jgi:hypothetical protein
MKQSDIIAANRVTADPQDWHKEKRRIELGAQEMLKPRSHSLYLREQTFKENTAEQLHDIQRDNLKRPGRGCSKRRTINVIT